MIHVIASIRVKAGRLLEFLVILKDNVPRVREERGCIEYFPALDIDAELRPEMPPQKFEPDVVTVIEKWESVEALRDHLVAPHMQAYRKRVKDIVENLSLKVLQEHEVSIEKNSDNLDNIRKEYLDASQNFRHYSGLRFIIFTAYLAVIAGIGYVALNDEAKYPAYVVKLAKTGGLAITLAFWNYEERAYQLLKHFRDQAKKLEERLNYTQFRDMPINLFPIYEPMYFTRVLFFVITLFWADTVYRLLSQ